MQRRDANIPGLSVAVVHNQQVVLALGLGLADLEQGTPATAETPVNRRINPAIDD